MSKTLRSKTFTASLSHDPHTLFSLIADPLNLPRWHSSFCRSLQQDKGSFVVSTPRGAVPVRFMRNDHSHVLDIVMKPTDDIELIAAIRILSNGDGAEVVLTLVQPEGLPDNLFQEHLRWTGNALQTLRKAIPESTGVTQDTPLPSASSIESPELPLSSSAGDEAKEMPADSTQSEEAANSPAPVGRRLYVGNLPFDWTEDPLRSLFADHGTVVQATIARFGSRGRSRGFGFVEMATESEAQIVIEKLHGSMAGSRKITVRLARTPEHKPSGESTAAATSAPQETSDSAMSSEESEIPEPGNSRLDPPIQQRPSARRGGRSAPRGRHRPMRQGRPSRSGEIVNTGGYEIFPRHTSGGRPTRRPFISSSRSSSADASPYMQDTGDIENHGGRSPRRGRRR